MNCYFGSDMRPIKVPRRLRNWVVDYVDYHPPYYVTKLVKNKPEGADPESTEYTACLKNRGIKFNQIDGKINRISYTGPYDVVNGRPRNPRGRVGIAGRGLLGKWGPNHVVDLAICRWTENGKIECVRIRRRDKGSIALPGGMVDDGEGFEEATISNVMKEVFNLPDMEERSKAHQWLIRNVPKAVVIHQGYISDYRKTDNAWVEKNFRACLEQEEDPIDFSIVPGYDAADAFWREMKKVPDPSQSAKEILKFLFSY